MLNISETLDHIGLYFKMLEAVFSKTERLKVHWINFLKEIDKLGVESFGIVAIISLFMGAVITLQTSAQMHSSLIPAYLVGFTTRQSTILEFSPTLSSLILAGKVGSNIASELGTMRITEQIDALEIMGVNSRSYLIFPKILATMVFNPILIIYSIALSIVGGWLVTTTLSTLTVADYMTGIYQDFKPFHVTYSLIKTVVFAFLITSISAYHGYYTKGGATAVGVSSTKAVVYGSIAILISNYILTQLILM